LADLRKFYNTQIEELPMDLSKIYDWEIIWVYDALYTT
jgi:hypothetical protein